MQWGYTWSLDVLEYEVMRSPMSSQGAALFWGFLDLSQPWESLDKTYEEGFFVGWSTNTGCDVEVLAIPKDGLDTRDLVWVPRLGFCPLTGLSPGLLLAFSLDITP
jgi:hypothetical protein